MGLLDGAFSAPDDTGGWLSKLAQQKRTPADNVAQRFPATLPGWLQPASMLGLGTPLPLFPPPPMQDDAAAAQLQPDIGFTPRMNAPPDPSASSLAAPRGATGPRTPFQQPGVQSGAPGTATGPWTEFQEQPSAIETASSAPTDAAAHDPFAWAVQTPERLRTTGQHAPGPLIDWFHQAAPVGSGLPTYAPPTLSELGEYFKWLPPDWTAGGASAPKLVAPMPNNPAKTPQIATDFVRGAVAPFWDASMYLGDVLRTGGQSFRLNEALGHGLDLAMMVAGPGRGGGRGAKLAVDEAARMARASDMGYSVDQPFYRGEASGNLPNEYLGGGHFSRDKGTAEGFAQKGGQAEPREFRLNLNKTFSDADALTAEQYARLVDAADPTLAANLVDMVAPGKDVEWFRDFASRRPDFAVTGPGGAKQIRHVIFGNSPAPEQLFKQAGYDALDSGRDVRKLTGEGVRLKSAKFDPRKWDSPDITASIAAGGVMAPFLLGGPTSDQR